MQAGVCNSLNWKYSFGQPADETKNYRTENNIFQYSTGYIYRHSHFIEPKGALIFRGNTYIQYADERFALWGTDNVIPMSEAADFLDTLFTKKITR